MLKKISTVITVMLLSSVTFNAVGASDMRQAVITSLKNKVELKFGASLWREASVNQLLRAGTSIRTGSLSKVELKYPDGTIARLGGRTNLTVLDKSIRAVKVDSGRLWFKVAKRSAGYRIYSPTAVAAITGTEGFVESGETEKDASINNRIASTDSNLRISESSESSYKAGLVEGSMNVFKGVDLNDEPIGEPNKVIEGQILSFVGNNFQIQNVGIDQIFNQYGEISRTSDDDSKTFDIKSQKLDKTNPTTEQIPNTINKQQDLNTSPTTGDLEIIIK